MRVIDVFSANKDCTSKVRPKKEFLNLIEGYGIEGDKFAGKDLDQTVMIVPIDGYEILKKEGIELEYGSLGENILVDFNIMELPKGTKLRIGEAELQITEHCTLCNHLAYFDKRVPKLVKDHRGVYCKILKSGKVKKGDEVAVAKT